MTDSKFLRNVLILSLLTPCSAILRPAYADTELNPDVSNKHAIENVSPLEYMQKIQSGWPTPFDQLSQKLDEQKSYVLVVAIPPSSPLDLRSADQLRKSFVGGHPEEMTIGHMTVGWSCAGDAGRARTFGYTAFTGEHGGQIRDMLMAGWGLTTFAAYFTDGHLQNPQELSDVFATVARDGLKPHFYLREVESAGCKAVPKAVFTFLNHPNLPFRNFGLGLDPEKMEGGGCGSFAAYLASKVPELAPAFATFWRRLDFPLSLLGRGSSLPADVVLPQVPLQDKSVSIALLLGRDWTAYAGVPTASIRILDPEMFFVYMRHLGNAAGQIPVREFVDYSKLSQFRRNGSGIYHRIPPEAIDRRFDAITDGVIASAEATRQELLQQGKRVDVLSVKDITGVAVTSP